MYHGINICVHLAGTGRHLITDALWELWYGESTVYYSCNDQKHN